MTKQANPRTNTSRTAVGIALGLALAGLAGAGAPPPAPASTATSVPALSTLPAFSLPDLEGKPHDSKDWAGKVVVVDFWATWCAACRETIPALNKLNDKYGPQGLAVVGVTLDKAPKEKVAKFSRKMKMGYLVLRDAEDTLSKVFGFEGLPSLYVFGRDGALLKALPNYTAAQDAELEAVLAAAFKP